MSCAGTRLVCVTGQSCARSPTKSYTIYAKTTQYVQLIHLRIVFLELKVRFEYNGMILVQIQIVYGSFCTAVRFESSRYNVPTSMYACLVSCIIKLNILTVILVVRSGECVRAITRRFSHVPANRSLWITAVEMSQRCLSRISIQIMFKHAGVGAKQIWCGFTYLSVVTTTGFHDSLCIDA